MTQRILIMGLPGSGKTTLAGALKKYLEDNGDISYGRALNQFVGDLKCEVTWFNADDIRRKYNDWDFSNDGRIRQSMRMFQFSTESGGDYVICDFVAPLVEMRNNFKADWTIWMDTIDAGRFEDTNQLFVEPAQYDFRVTEQNADKWAEFIGEHIVANRRRPIFDWQKESALLLGRYQPWHAGHRALFERAIAKTGQVVIQVRDCQGWNGSNPFEFNKVKELIQRDLDPVFRGQYEIQLVPNIVEIVYGRDVGYQINKIELTDELHAISATKIRAEMKSKGLL
jgi:energy-coupling factor transporter ATP-binding protein EcfA2